MRLPTSSEIELVLQVAERAGIEFCVHRCHMLDAKMAALWMSDPEACRAAAEGVTVEQLRRFDERNGIAQCGAITSKGQRCRNSPVDTKYNWGAKDFVESDGGYCAVHGGA